MRFFYFIFMVSTFVFGQNKYPAAYFRSPLDIPLQLSGNFGELRPNHFHSGFDFKTMQKEGLMVYAAADGYISRIKISEGGYGKAIYITHPNGYTSVYGHLQSGVGEIEKYIKKEQYKAKLYEIDVYLKPNELITNKGDIIAISGNTGGSEGPHLHFEIRDTQTEKIINPMCFGFDSALKDAKPPVISTLIVYPIGENSVVNQANRPIVLNLSLQKNGNYIAEKVAASGKIGFGITTTDFDDVSWNANGAFKVETFLNGKSDFSYQFDTFSFDESRYVNALIDYSRYKTLGQRVQKMFMVNPYSLSLINHDLNDGIVTVLPNVTQNYRIEVSDFQGNKTTVHIPIQYSNFPAKVKMVPTTSKYLVKSDRDNIFAEKNVTVTFPANTFYDDFYMDFQVRDNIVKLHKDIVPAHTNFSIAIEDSIMPKKDREKTFLGLIDGKRISYYNTKKSKNSFTINTKYLGEYKLVKDVVAPTIKIDKNTEGKWITSQNELVFTISDGLSGIGSYNAYLNGEWILMEYERKTNKLTHHFSDGVVSEGKNDLKLIVTDNVGNSAIFETHFFRSQKP